MENYFQKPTICLERILPYLKEGEIPTDMYMRKIAPMHTNSDTDITDTTEINQSEYTCYIKPYPLHTM